MLARLEPDIQVMLAIGGGTVHDITRYCSTERGIPFISIPTAASCDGFCSNVAAMTWHGYKKTIPCQAPLLVVADLDVISAAPWRLTASGIGDMLGKFIALTDWRISHLLTGEKLCPVIYQIMEDAVDSIWTRCRDLAQRRLRRLRGGSLRAFDERTCHADDWHLPPCLWSGTPCIPFH